MSAYENVVGGKLKLKGKPLDVKAGAGLKKKKKKKTNKILHNNFQNTNTGGGGGDGGDGGEVSQGGSTGTVTDLMIQLEDSNDGNKSGEGNNASYLDTLTPAERRYMEQRQQIDIHKLAKTANKSHRDRISDFNQYLANMSEHYDIPKVGPG